MTRESLAAKLAEKVMGWRVGPDRFMMADRGWLKREAFQPTKSLNDAYRLVAAVKPMEYQLGGSASGPCWAKVKLKASSGEATNQSLPLAICLAIACALGIDVETLD